MIDYDLVLVMGPNLLIGALLGSALNAMAPPWLILILLIVILCQSAYKTFTKAIQTWRKERSDGNTGAHSAGDSRLSKNPIERLLRRCFPQRYGQFNDNELSSSKDAATIPPQLVGAGSLEQAGIHLQVNGAADSSELAAEDLPQPPGAAPVESVASRQQVQFPKRRLAILALMWIIVVLSIFIRGGPASPGLVRFCSISYWLLAVVTAFILECISVFAVTRAIAHGSPPGESGGLHWTPRSARKIMIWSLMAGTMAAMCGIGGGMVMGPILLNLGFLPQVQSATTATTLFVMSTSTCIAFLVAGTAPADYALWLAFATAVGAVCGKAIIGWLVKRLKRPSLIMFLLGGIIGTSVVVMFITGLLDVVSDIREGKDMSFKGFCPTDEEE